MGMKGSLCFILVVDNFGFAYHRHHTPGLGAWHFHRSIGERYRSDRAIGSIVDRLKRMIEQIEIVDATEFNIGIAF
jgi:hypothetical protein